MKKYLISIIVTMMLIATIFYIVPYHGTRVTEVYDIEKETVLSDFGMLALDNNVSVEQHFYANTYCLKGINYVLLGIDEESTGELEFAVETNDGKRLFAKRVAYQNIEAGQWENVELPTHLQQGHEYCLKVTNLSQDELPIILTGSSKNVSQAESSLFIDGEEQSEQLYLGFGFRSEYSRIGKIILCFVAGIIWAVIMYILWLDKNCFKKDAQGNEKDARKYYFDFLRVIAIWMVIYNHTVRNGFMLYSEECGTIIFWIELAFSIFIVVAVPLFWMMSGALLLKKEEDIKTLFVKRILRFLIILIIFSFLQYIYKQISGNLTEEDGNYFKWLYVMTDGVPAYWYLYAYLGYLLMLPAIRKIAKGFNKKEFQYTFIIYIIYTGLLPLFEYFVLNEKYHLRGDFQIPIMATSCIVYALLGYYAEYVKQDDEYTNKQFVRLIIGSLICIFVTAIATKYRCETYQKWSEVFSQLFFKCLTIVPAYTVYYGTKMWSIRHTVSPKVKKIGTIAGGSTFGLMLIENIVREKMNFVFDFFTPHFGKFLGGILWVTSIVVVGLCISMFLKKLPFLKKLL